MQAAMRTAGRKPAESGPEAAWRQAQAILYGDGPTAIDRRRALPPLCVAAQHGHCDAQFELALLYLEGRMVRQDRSIAASWLESAARSGHPRARYWLARCYLTGEGRPQDFGEAYRLVQLNRAAGWGDPGELGRTASMQMPMARRLALDAALAGELESPAVQRSPRP